MLQFNIDTNIGYKFMNRDLSFENCISIVPKLFLIKLQNLHETGNIRNHIV